jgi:hypothetical protein
MVEGSIELLSGLVVVVLPILTALGIIASVIAALRAVSRGSHTQGAKR